VHLLTRQAKPQGSSSSPFRPDIEGLRGVAVLIVVAFHCGIPGFSGGFVGVDVFFVLSGYLITGLLIAEIHKTARLNLLQFYARRVRRLLPASALTLVTTLSIGALILAPQELAFAGRAGRASALYMSNVFFALNAADYFAPDVKSNPILHTWSLAVEEQFYLFWPLLIMLGLQWLRSSRALLALLCGLSVASLGASVWFTANGGTFAFYQLPARAWEFGIGGLAVLPPRGGLKLPSVFGLALGWLGLLVIVASGCLISDSANFPGWIALLPVIGTVAALVAGAECPNRGVSVVLNSTPLQMLGRLSYSWYLWHWPVLVFSAALFPNISMAGKIAAAAASLALAGASHHFVENPIRFHTSLVKRPALSIGLAGALTLCSVGVAVLSIRFASRLAEAPGIRSITAAVNDIAAMPRQECVALQETEEVKTCVFGNEFSATNIVLFGDSHAIQWFNPLQQIAETHGWKLTTMVKSGCPATDIAPPRSSARFAATCAGWRAEAIRRIVSLRPSIVFIGNGTNYLGRNDGLRSQSDISLDTWEKGTRRTLEALVAAGLRVAAMRDNPLSAFDIPTCLARSFRHTWYPGGSCQMVRSEVLNPAIFEAEKAGARGLRNVHFIDLTGEFCGDEVCWAVQKDEVMYRDNNHLTGNFANRLAPLLEAELLPILNASR
jgi:peptidoglycan/LPS O-acetylase OafA/YrhL